MSIIPISHDDMLNSETCEIFNKLINVTEYIEKHHNKDKIKYFIEHSKLKILEYKIELNNLDKRKTKLDSIINEMDYLLNKHLEFLLYSNNNIYYNY